MPGNRSVYDRSMVTHILNVGTYKSLIGIILPIHIASAILAVMLLCGDDDFVGHNSDCLFMNNGYDFDLSFPSSAETVANS